MAKHSLIVMIFLVAALFMLGSGVQASGVVKFEVEITSGLKFSSTDVLEFPPVGPGQTVQQDLEITVWSNTAWGLSVQAEGYGDEDTLSGAIQFRYSGIWRDLSMESSTICVEQPPTGQEGVTVQIPFRIEGGYGHQPGDYSFLVKFTVVSSI